MAKNDRLMATAWRFEVNKGNPNSMRFKQDALVQEKEADARIQKSMAKIPLEAFRTHWNDKFTEGNERARDKIVEKRHKDDLNIIRKANMLVRRDALKDLYLKEYHLYEAELRTKGLSIHKERI